MGRYFIIKIIIGIIACGCIIFGATWLSHYKTNFPIPDSRTTQDFMAPLLKQEPQLFTSNNTPVFTISKINHITKSWYILTIKAKNDNSGISSKLLINDPYFSTDYMNVVAGPETTFSKAELTVDNIPDKVMQEAMR